MNHIQLEAMEILQAYNEKEINLTQGVLESMSNIGLFVAFAGLYMERKRGTEHLELLIMAVKEAKRFQLEELGQC